MDFSSVEISTALHFSFQNLYLSNAGCVGLSGTFWKTWALIRASVPHFQLVYIFWTCNYFWFKGLRSGISSKCCSLALSFPSIICLSYIIFCFQLSRAPVFWFLIFFFIVGAQSKMDFPKLLFKVMDVKRWRLVFWNSNHLEVASDSFCFLLYSSWLLVFILYVFNLFFLSLNLFCWKGFHFS